MSSIAGIMIAVFIVFLALVFIVAPIIVIICVTSSARRAQKTAEKALHIRK